MVDNVHVITFVMKENHSLLYRKHNITNYIREQFPISNEQQQFTVGQKLPIKQQCTHLHITCKHKREATQQTAYYIFDHLKSNAHIFVSAVSYRIFWDPLSKGQMCVCPRVWLPFKLCIKVLLRTFIQKMLENICERHFKSIYRKFKQICHHLGLILFPPALKLHRNIGSAVCEIFCVMYRVTLSQSQGEKTSCTTLQLFVKSDQWCRRKPRQSNNTQSITSLQLKQTDFSAKGASYFLSNIIKLAVSGERLNSVLEYSFHSFHCNSSSH